MTDRKTPPVEVGADLGTMGQLGAVALALAADVGATHRAVANWAYDSSLLDLPLEGGLQIAESLVAKWGSEVILRHAPTGAFAHAACSERNLACWCFGREPHDATNLLRLLTERWERIDDEEREEIIPVEFWVYGMHGPRSIRRDLDAPAWTDIARNYPEPARGALGALLDEGFRPSAGGQLILWHGSPGTGKTTALRALARQWRGWCRAHYVTDPEKFFGAHADYMLDVLLQGELEGAVLVSPHGSDEPEPEPDWRLLILEDTGELLQKDAKRETGQALSRFLNAVDGLIGQGLRVLVLVTTNEELGALHDAVARPGRCAAIVEFPSFEAAEADRWLEAHDAEPLGTRGRRTLAELYAHREGARVGDLERLVGFAR